MRVYFKKGYILVISESIVKSVGKLQGIPYAKGMAFFPFILLREYKYASQQIINHELIHFRQELEMLIIGFYIFRTVEKLYIRIIKKKRGLDAYLLLSTEQEAYLFSNSLDYLRKRKAYSFFKYLKQKNQMHFGSPDSGVIYINGVEQRMY